MSEKGALLAEGRTAEIYAWGTNQILKLYREGWYEGDAEYEHLQALASQKTGYRVPAVGELVQIDGRHGIIYQRIEGRTMLEEMISRPWRLFRYSRQMAHLHAEMHTCTASELTKSRDRLGRKIRQAVQLDPAAREAVLEHLAGLPDEEKLLHGDFHPDNIMLTAEGPMIIDWIDATMGHPLADVARTVVIASVGVPPDDRLMGMFVKVILNRYLSTYFDLSPYSREELDAWMLPVAAARLEENIPYEVERLVGLVKELLHK